MNKHADPLKCPRCGAGGSLAIQPGSLNVEYVVCESCGHALPITWGVPNFAEDINAQTTKLPLTQKIMETRLFAKIYETPVWRPLHTYISTGKSVQAQLEEMLALSGDHPRDVVLDLACGTGHFTRAFAKNWPDANLYGLDLSFSMLREAVSRAKKDELDNVVFIRGSIFDLPFLDNTIDHVNCCGALHLFQDQPTIWKEISRILKPGGLFTGEAIAIDPKVEKIQRVVEKSRGASFIQPEVFRAQLQDVGLESMEHTQRKVIMTFRSVKAE